ncbi:MAG: hypothetical protein ACLPY5_00655 [Candidatus Bathyarchaeia archaeon]
MVAFVECGQMIEMPTEVAGIKINYLLRSFQFGSSDIDPGGGG